MRLSFHHQERTLHRETDQPVACFLRGEETWFSQWTLRQTRNEGWFLADTQTVPHTFAKILERISLQPWLNHQPDAVAVSQNTVRFSWENHHLALVPSGSQGLSILCGSMSPVVLTLDMRGIYQYPEEGRAYTLEDQKGGVLVTYTDPLLASPLYLHIRGPVRAADLSSATWDHAVYPRDTARHSPPEDRYVYTLPAITASRLDLGCGRSAQAAVKASAQASETRPDHLEEAQEGSLEEMAASFAAQGLTSLRSGASYYAGLPWFFQFWSRDELITGLGLAPQEQLAMIKRYLAIGTQQGELPTFIGSGTTCADGLGWLALLVREYGLSNLGPETREQLRIFLTEAYQGLAEHRRAPSGLIWSGHNATWMDTIGRQGFRVEIQALYGLVLQLLAQLTNNHRFEEERQALFGAVRHHLWQESCLLDGLTENLQPDRSIRPNVFLAYLASPDLLSPAQWRSTFTETLNALLTSWGGLRSLEKSAPEYQDYSTGEDNRSYHLGDSWFFINNLAAVALQRFDDQVFGDTAHTILTASAEEIVSRHFLGYPAEIASAADGASWGCGLQAWSAGTYLFATKKGPSA